MDFSRVRVTGRCPKDGSVLWLTFSLSEVAFLLKGATYFRLMLCGEDRAGDPEKENLAPRFAVDRDGMRLADARLIKGEESFFFDLGPGAGETAVRLVKLSECTQSLLGLREIETDGEMAPLPEAEGLRLEFIGDSITCGYGVEAAGSAEGFSTATENAEKSYAGLLCRDLRATGMLTAFSGHGIVSGYTGDPAVRNLDLLVPPLYEKAGSNGFPLPSGRLLQEMTWDFSRFRPQVILVNLGTNDLSWCGEDPARKALFRKEYAAFLQVIRRHNPDSRILCVLGLMGTGLNDAMRQAVADYQAKTGDAAIRVLTVPEQNLERDGAGADFHPSARTQRLFAERIKQELRTMGIVRE